MTTRQSQIDLRQKRPTAIRMVLPFVFAHWRNQPWRSAGLCAAMLGATISDVFMPLFAGKLVDAVALGASDLTRALSDAYAAFGIIIALGLAQIAMRHVGLTSIVPFTLRVMSDIARDAFHRVQRFSTDWHANSFAGSTVRKITRGMWAVDLLDDTVFLALLPSLAVLLGSMVILGWHWPALGLVIAAGAIAYITMTVLFSTRYIAPAARASNALDSKVGGTLADALTCNPVVKSFGAEHREDANWRVSSPDGACACGGRGCVSPSPVRCSSACCCAFAPR